MKVREEFDEHRTETAMQATNYPTEKNKHGLYCSICGKQFFVNEIIFEKVNNAIREGFDNSIVCDDCQNDLDERAYY